MPTLTEDTLREALAAFPGRKVRLVVGPGKDELSAGRLCKAGMRPVRRCYNADGSWRDDAQMESVAPPIPLEVAVDPGATDWHVEAVA